MCCGTTSVVRIHEDLACVCFLLSSPSWFCKALLFSGCPKTLKCIFLLFSHQGRPSISLLCCMGPSLLQIMQHIGTQPTLSSCGPPHQLPPNGRIFRAFSLASFCLQVCLLYSDHHGAPLSPGLMSTQSRKHDHLSIKSPGLMKCGPAVLNFRIYFLSSSFWFLQ